MRQIRRLQDRAIELAAKNRWAEAVEANKQALAVEEDADSYNRLGKAYFELGDFQKARDSYQRALRITPSNRIARKNLERIEDLIVQNVSMPIARTDRQLVDLRLFITETGRTAVTTLLDLVRSAAADAVVTGEKLELQIDGRNVFVTDVEGNRLGRIEPKLAQRLIELIQGGNRYIAAAAQSDSKTIRVLIREMYQDPSQRGRVSFPGKLGEGALRGYIGNTRFDEYGDDMLDDEDTNDDTEDVEEETFNSDDEELGLDDIEQDISEDEDMGEE